MHREMWIGRMGAVAMLAAAVVAGASLTSCSGKNSAASDSGSGAAALLGERDVATVAGGLDFFKQQIFGTQNVPINRELLERMSKTTGGAFFEATDRKGLESSFHSILDALERSRIADQGVVWSEAFRRYLWPALVLMTLDLLLVLAVLRRTP
jgi:Ca-activated chloride channel homolog